MEQSRRSPPWWASQQVGDSTMILQRVEGLLRSWLVQQLKKNRQRCNQNGKQIETRTSNLAIAPESNKSTKKDRKIKRSYVAGLHD